MSLSREHHVVAMYDGRATTIAEDARNLTRLATEDQTSIVIIVGDKPACDLIGRAVENANRIATLKLPINRHDAGRKQALAALQCERCAIVDGEASERLLLTANPFLARGNRVGRR